MQSLARLPLLEKLDLQYAYFGDSGAGERVAAALAKYQRKLMELRLYECGVNDTMLGSICCITSLRRLLIQDEDAPEESCPTSKGPSVCYGLSCVVSQPSPCHGRSGASL